MLYILQMGERGVEGVVVHEFFKGVIICDQERDLMVS